MRKTSDANLRAEIRNEVLGEVCAAADSASDFSDFRDALESSDPSLPGLSVTDIAAMSEDEINANWSAVSRALEENARTGAPPPPSDTDEGSSGRLTMDRIRRMSADEINRRWPEVSAFLGRSA